MKKQVEYDFSKPIILVQYKSCGIDIMIYSAILAVLAGSLFFILFIHDGEFAIEFTLARTLISMPLIILCVFVKEMLMELYKYPKLLLNKKKWLLKDMMLLTQKDENETKRIMTRVLEASFKVDVNCIITNQD